jgi:aryl-alcohol dehydrogenase
MRLAGEPVTAAFFQQSSFATHAITLERNVVPIDQGLSAQMAAPLGCGIMTGAGSILNTLKVGAKDSLVVYGAGTVGLSAIMAGHIVGAAPLIAVDINVGRLELALELGATHAFSAVEGEIPERVREVCPRGATFSFESSGVEQALNDAIACLAIGGHCGMVTVPHSGQKYPFSPSEVFYRAANLQGIFVGSSVPQTLLPQLIEFQREGRFPYDRLIKTYDFSDINQAFRDMKSGKAIKPVLLMD